MRTIVVAAILAACLATIGGELAPRVRAAPQGIEKIEHVVVIMQENRSFDSYFGTFPGADGIPMRDGVPRQRRVPRVHRRLTLGAL